MKAPVESIRCGIRFLAPLLALCLLSGCGKDAGPTGKASGTLQYKGQPLPAGHVVVFMEPKSGRVAFGKTDVAGKFRIDSWNKGNLPVGSYEVTIRPPQEVGAEAGDSPAPPKESAGPPKQARLGFAFPAKYAETASSGLKREVKAGDNDFPIELTD